jgi:hypothetical protein
MEADDTLQSAAKRQKTQDSGSKRPYVSRHKRAVKAAAPTTQTTARSAPPHATTTNSKRTFRHKQKKRPQRKPASTPPPPPAKPEPRGLLSLALETKQQIFLYTSARDTARLRRVCKALNVDVKSSTKYLAKQFSRKETERIQQEFDEFASLKPPTDVDSLMTALHVWTKRRGIFYEDRVQLDSCTKLMTYLLNREGTGAPFRNAVSVVKWATVAACAAIRHRGFRDEEMEDLDMDSFFETITTPGFLDYKDCDKLLEMVKSPELLLSGRLWPPGTREPTTFPERGRMMPLLQFPIWSDHDPLSDEHDQQTQALVDYIFGNPTMPLLEATHGNVHLIRYLRLPALPNEVACYYLNAEWARKEANKLFDPVAIRANPVRVSPLLIAAILESVMLFGVELG